MKNSRWLLSVLGAAALLCGCAAPAPVPAPQPAPVAMAAPEPPPQCNADGAKFAIGQIATPQLESAARVRADAEVSRILKPKQAVTMEFNSSRLNLVVDGRNKVTAVRCG